MNFRFYNLNLSKVEFVEDLEFITLHLESLLLLSIDRGLSTMDYFTP